MDEHRPAGWKGNPLGFESALTPDVHDSVMLPRFLLSAASSGGADASRLARDAGIPGWVLAVGQARVPARFSIQVWELLEHALEDPDLPLTIAGRHQIGQLDLFDYLFATAPTVRTGFQATQDFLHLVTTSSRIRVVAETDRDLTYSYAHTFRDRRGGELGAQFHLAVACARAREAAGQLIAPSRVAFAQPAPRSHRALTETFGTSQVDFGYPVNTLTFRKADLELPLRTADPALARILRRYAATLPLPPEATWKEHFRRLLDEAIDHGSPSLDAVARRLVVSRRTLQRQLAEQGTSWRTELDAVRHSRALAARQDPSAGTARLARKLGYTDPRSASRALRRWGDREP